VNEEFPKGEDGTVRNAIDYLKAKRCKSNQYVLDYVWTDSPNVQIVSSLTFGGFLFCFCRIQLILNNIAKLKIFKYSVKV
jgi:hypothetical protein